MRSPQGAAREVLLRAERREVTLVMDYKLALEYHAVALRPEQLSVCQLSAADMLKAITDIEDLAERVETTLKLRPISTDPNDDMMIELAVSASVDAIVTSNTRHFAPVTRKFGIAVLTAAELIDRLRTGRTAWQNR